MEKNVVDGKVFAVPGPGVWELESFHITRPVSPIVEELFLVDFAPGFREGLAPYGALLSHFEFASVHRFIYMQPSLVGVPRDAKGPPPTAVVWLMTRAHPAMRARLAMGPAAFEKRLWRDDLRRWDEHEKPSLNHAFAKLSSKPLAALTDEALATHLEDVRAELKRAFRLRHRFTASAVAPVGDFVAHVMEWTGLPLADVLESLRGSSRVSLGLEADSLRDLLPILRREPGAIDALHGDAPAAEVFASIAAREDELGAGFRAWFTPVSKRCVGVDPAEPTYAEAPEMLRKSLLASLAQSEVRDDRGARVAKLRGRVPAKHHARFDELEGEASSTYRLRDERGTFTDGRLGGVLHAALIAAGERLVARGRLDDAKLAVDGHPTEVAELLLGKNTVTRDELDERRRWRSSHTVDDAPPSLGGTPSGPPPVETLPPHARRAARAMDVYIGNMFCPAKAQGEKKVVRGLPASMGTYEGRARVLAGPEEIHRIEQGDVLVSSITTVHYNAALPLVGALVTERGGQLSHAAVVAREFSIPAVVATGSATKVIPDGARVRVDGDRGVVTILS